MVAEIIKGKAIPSLRRKGAAPKYPWRSLQPGDAFKFDPEVTFAGARSMASQYQVADLANVKFVVRQEADGIYCWRVDGTAYALVNGNRTQEAPKIDGFKPGKATGAALVSDRPHEPIRAEAEEVDPI